jgi:hypothetical protein
MNTKRLHRAARSAEGLFAILNLALLPATVGLWLGERSKAGIENEVPVTSPPVAIASVATNSHAASSAHYPPKWEADARTAFHALCYLLDPRV